MSQEENIEKVQQEPKQEQKQEQGQQEEQQQEKPIETKSTLDILPEKNEEYKTKEYWEKYVSKSYI